MIFGSPTAGEVCCILHSDDEMKARQFSLLPTYANMDQASYQSVNADLIRSFSTRIPANMVNAPSGTTGKRS